MAVVTRVSFLRASVVAMTALMAASAAQAGPLDFLMRPAPPAPVGNAPTLGGGQIVQVQGADAQFQIGQLQEEIRRLNGRIEELGFQMLQIQEQMRQTQEDNEFRFQALEGGAPTGDATRTDSITNGAGSSSNDGASADLPGLQPDVAAAPTQSPASPTPNAQAPTNTAPGETQLGSLTFDEQGNLSQTLDTATSGSNAAGNGQVASLSMDDPDALYRDAYSLVLAGDYADAEAAFRDYIDVFPDGGQIANAHFWLGESQFSQGSFNDSARTFLNAHQNFPEAEKAPEMLLKLGMSLAALDNRDTACATYREVLSRYPDASASVKDKVTREQSNASC